MTHQRVFRELNFSATLSPACASAPPSAFYRTALRHIDAQLVRISKLADTSPEMAHEVIAELRTSLRASSDRLDESRKQMLAEQDSIVIATAATRVAGLRKSLDRIAEWSKNQQAVQETDLMVSFGVVRRDVHRVMHRNWGLYMSSKISDARHFF